MCKNGEPHDHARCEGALTKGTEAYTEVMASMVHHGWSMGCLHRGWKRKGERLMGTCADSGRVQPFAAFAWAFAPRHAAFGQLPPSPLPLSSPSPVVGNLLRSASRHPRLPLRFPLRDRGRRGRVGVPWAFSPAGRRAPSSSHPPSGPSTTYSLIITVMKSHRQWSLAVLLRPAPFGIQYKTGRILQGVAPGSPAERAGLRSGDLIVEVQGQQCWNAQFLNILGVIQEVGRMLMRTAVYAGRPGQKGARASGGPGPLAHDSGYPEAEATTLSDAWSSWIGVNIPQKVCSATPPGTRKTPEVLVKGRSGLRRLALPGRLLP